MRNERNSTLEEIKFVKTMAKQIISDEKILQRAKPDMFLHLKNHLVRLITKIEQIETRDEELILLRNEHSEIFETEMSEFENPFSQQEIRNHMFCGSFFNDDENINNISHITMMLQIILLPNYCRQHYIANINKTLAKTTNEQTHNFA